MCGIAGYIADSAFPDGLIEGMTDALAHRGPDGRGILRDRGWGLALGHRRLSIIDPAGGSQPMRDASGRYVAVFNGEIYNYRALREELAGSTAFRTDSDTEVLLAAYRRYGAETCAKLNGMYAFAIADLRERVLFLARDPMGEKPLYYVHDDGVFAFASEMKALLLLPGLRRQVDAAALHHYLSLNYVPGEQTMLSGVRRVPAGCSLTVRDGQLARRSHGVIGAAVGRVRVDTAVEELGALLDDAVRLRLRSDVPVGAFLSSGVDSSLICSSVQRVAASPVTAFSAGFEDRRFDETPGARATARRLGMPFVSRTVRPDAEALFDELVRHADDPLGDSSALATYHVCRVASEQCKVALGGDGADELFGGYLTHRAGLAARYYRRMPDWVRGLARRCAARMAGGGAKVGAGYKFRRFVERSELSAGAAHLAYNGAWMERDKRSLYDPAWSVRTRGLDSFEHLAAALDLGAFDLERVLTADQRQYLPDDILVKTDRMSMACGLEVRSPWLDRRIVAFAAGLPAELKTSVFANKIILRRLARRRGLGAAARRGKRGFSIPVQGWLRGPLREKMLELLATSRLAATGIFDAREVHERIAAHLSGREDYGFELWGLMAFMSWHRQFIEGPAPAARGRASWLGRLEAVGV